MGDVADILGMASKPTTTGVDDILGEKVKTTKNLKKSKPKGMNRELFSLMGADTITPAIVTTKFNPGFKNKRTNNTKAKWVLAPFRNSARRQVF